MAPKAWAAMPIGLKFLESEPWLKIEDCSCSGIWLLVFSLSCWNWLFKFLKGLGP